MSDVTQILNAIEDGDPQAAEKLLPLVYEELRKLARHKMAQESPDHTLQATALVHEAYIRLVGSKNGNEWDNRGHFFAAAAEAMRRILVDNARRKKRLKFGENIQKHNIDVLDISYETHSNELLMIHDALEDLHSTDSAAAELVKLRYFAGFTVSEAATILKISDRKANQIWAYARVWLLDNIAAKNSTDSK